MKRKKFLRGLIALTLCTVMSIQSVPTELLQAAADELKEILTQEETSESIEETDALKGKLSDKENLGQGYIIEEDVSKRTLNTKEFVMSDDTIMVQQFGEAVHYLEDGEYKEIDNSLVEEKTEAGETYYRNNANAFNVKIQNEPTSESDLVEIEEDGYSLNFGYKAKKEQKEKKVKTKAKGFEKKEKEFKYKDKKLKHPVEQSSTTGEVTYENIDENTHLVYQIKNNGVKENIIVSEAQEEYSYTFKIKTKGLTLFQNDDGSIYANTETGETKFVIPSPFMVDAEGEYSDAVYYTLTEYNNKTELTITADETWINEQASFPVTIDPIIESYTQTGFSCVTVDSNGNRTLNGDLYAGKKTAGVKNDSFLKFELGLAPIQYELLSVSFTFDYATRGMNPVRWKDLLCQIHIVDSAMDVADIRYNNKPTRLAGMPGIDHTPQTQEREVTYASQMISLAYISNNALSFGIECLDGNSDGGYIEILSSSLHLTYRNMGGLDSAYSTETFSIEGATAYANNVSGLLTVTSEVASVNTLSSLNLSASLIYNYGYNDTLNELGAAKSFGNNFKINYQQYLRSGDGSYYEWVDADGTAVLFYPNADGTYRSKLSLLTFTRGGSNNSGTITDGQGNTLVFTDGRLTKIQNINEPTEEIVLSYDIDNEQNISKVEYKKNNAVKSKIEFTYANGKATEIATYRGAAEELANYELRYDALGNLTGIFNVNANLLTLTFDYTQESYEGEMLSVFNYQHEGLEFEIDEFDKQIKRVRQVCGTEIAEDKYRAYEYVNFTFDGVRKTSVEYYSNGVKVGGKYIAFNNRGTAISQWQEDSQGRIYVSNDLNWQDREAATDNAYVSQSCQYQSNTNTASQTVGAGATLNETISGSSLGIESNKDMYKYAVSFKVSGSSPLDLTVTVNGTTHDIYLDNVKELYVSILCSHISSGTLKIKNNGSEARTISEITYTPIAYTQTQIETDETTETIKTTTISYSKTGTYAKSVTEKKHNENTTKYISTETKSVDNPSLLETTTYTYNADNKVTRVETKNGNTLISKTDYTYYTDDAGDFSETIAITTQGEFQTYSRVSQHDTGSTGYTITQADASGTTTYHYNKEAGDIRLTGITYGDTSEQYTYNYLGQITSVTVRNITETVYTQTNEYVNGVYTGSTYSGTQYQYTYESTGLVEKILENNAPKITYDYEDPDGLNDTQALQRKTYANGQVEEYDYASNKYTVTHKNSAAATSASAVYEYRLDSKGNLTSQAHKAGNNSGIYYSYDTSDKYKPEFEITGAGVRYGMTYTVEYDKTNNRATGFKLYSLGSCQTTECKNGYYTYDNKGRLASSSYGTSWEEQYTYDALGRMVGLVNMDYTREVQNLTFGYQTINGYATNRLVSITDNTYNAINSTSTYDANGYITGITYGNQTHAYEYDGLGRLTKETINGTTKTYSYDSQNNIQKSGLTYTNGKLTEVNGAQIDYDEMGNPIVYKGNTFVWEQGRKLASGTMNGKNFAYTYDPNGMRYKKVVNGATTNFYYNGTQLLIEDRVNGIGRIYYIYGASGIAGMVLQEGYSPKTYYFDKNTLGDIIAIRDENGNVVASYKYDAWGNHTVHNEYGGIDYSATSIGHINPFRYRGYYYDTETGFYYLQTRYYDPTICRFINADNYELVSELASSMQLNMYAYCGNNPIMYTDPTGLWIETVFDLFSLGVSVVEVVINPANPWAWAGLVGDAVDLLPFVTGVGEGVKATKLVKYADDMYDATLATVRITKAVDFTSDALGTMKTLDRVGDFTQSSLSAGRRIHQGYKLGLPGKEFSRVPGMRMDFFDGTNIFELKPYNRNSLRRGINQLLRYNNGLGGEYIMILEFY